jgi:Big-like domain-containing protein
MKRLSLVVAAVMILPLSTACDEVSTAPSPTPAVLTDVQVSMFGFNGTFTSDGAVLLGRTFQMTATARFSNGGEDVTRAASWESSNPSVGPITSGGLLTGLVTGTTLVTATYQGKSGSLVVMVSDMP